MALVWPTDLAVPGHSSVAIREPGAAPRALQSRADPPGEAQTEFWTSYIRLGFLILVAESICTLGYFAATPSGPNRGLLVPFAALVAVGAVVGTRTVERVSCEPWRISYSSVCSVAAGVVLAVCICLDRGLDSPLLSFLILPVVFAAVGLPLRAVVACGAAATAELLTIALTDGTVSTEQSHLLLLFALIGGVIVFSVLAATHRVRLGTREQELVADLWRRSETDGLTGCLNHGAFYSRLGVEIDRALRHDRPLALLMADVDLLKAFNDAHGHAAGDEALAATAGVLRTTCRTTDAVARVGGDEFAVIMPETGGEMALEVAERLAAGVRANGTVTLSMGVSVLNEAEPTVARIFRDADAALYRAKAAGRARVEAGFPGSPSDGACEQLTLAWEDRKVLEHQLRQSMRKMAESLSILETWQASAPVGLGFIDRELRVVRINPVLVEASGVPADAQIGRTVAEAVPDLWPQLEPMLLQVLGAGRPVTDDFALPAPDGDGKVWNTTLYPVRVEGELFGIGVVAVDVTKRETERANLMAMTRNTVDALAAATEARDPYTAGHQRRVAEIASVIAADLGCDPAAIADIDLAGRVHDVGKVTIPSEILNRPGRLSPEEMALVRSHARAGFDILTRVAFSAGVAEMVLHHHERLDGSGYPDGLAGDEISLGARIIAVADVVEAIAAHRPYRPALGAQKAREFLKSGSGVLFDPHVVTSCIRLLGEGALPMIGADGDEGTVEVRSAV